eukprot:2730217-Rhodomonas_salina.2
MTVSACTGGESSVRARRSRCHGARVASRFSIFWEQSKFCFRYPGTKFSQLCWKQEPWLSLIHISEPTRPRLI